MAAWYAYFVGRFPAGWPLADGTLVAQGGYVLALLAVFATLAAVAVVLEVLALRRQRQQVVDPLALLLESVPDAMIGVNSDGRIVLLNRRAEEMFGYTRDQLIGKPVEILVPESLRRPHMEHRREYAAEPRARPMGIGLDLVAVRADGSELPVEISLSPMGTPSGMLVLAAVRDVSRRRRTEEEKRKTAAALEAANRELAQSNAELEQFAYVASHDLQEPLRMVSSYVQLLARRYRGKLDADADEFIGYAVDGAKRMQQLTNDLLVYSRVQRRGKPPEPVNLEEVLADVVQNLKESLSTEGAGVTHDPLPTVQADRTQMVQIFQNLVGNGLKFHGPQPPQVHVWAEPQNGHWVISVRDNGIGIDPKYADRVFSLFQRLHSRDEYPGTGIGLAICKRIAERHRGRIWFDSHPDRGTTFHFTIPQEGLPDEPADADETD